MARAGRHRDGAAGARQWLRETTGAKNLCIAGGVGLNCVANGRIVREAGFDNVWIQPASGDDGIAIGCAYYGHLALKGEPRTLRHDARLSRAQLRRRGRERRARRRARRGCETTARVSEDICAETAKLFAEGRVIGWFQGRSEFGPRALGNRSILADPRDAKMKDILNARVKHRQAFRPFAPIVLDERAHEIFEGEEESPFMLHCQARARRNGRRRFRRSCTSTAPRACRRCGGDQRRLYRLLKEFEALTGVPVLINTSFNVKGEPIVETPRDAIECFLSTGIDDLVLHDRIVAKTAFHRAIAPVMGMYADIAAMVRAGLNAD